MGPAFGYSLTEQFERPRRYKREWGFAEPRIVYESFTRPNAHCPVCGATVFFYQSPDGGRVFFDELGPPWPKHPCTDRSATLLDPPRSSSAPTEPERRTFRKEGWMPVFSATWHPRSKQLGLRLLSGRAGRARQPFVVALPHGSRLDRHAPVFVRPAPEIDNGLWLTSPGHTTSLMTWQVDAFAVTDRDLAQLALAANDGETIVHLAWRLSFGSDDLPGRGDFVLGRRLYEAAARVGCWRAFNDLGVIYERGLGVSADSRRAHAYFRRAGREGDETSLANAAGCTWAGGGKGVRPIPAWVISRQERRRARLRS